MNFNDVEKTIIIVMLILIFVYFMFNQKYLTNSDMFNILFLCGLGILIIGLIKANY